MTIKKAVVAHLIFFGDGSSTTVTVDLEKDPYSVGGTGDLVNYFSEVKHVNEPVSAFTFDPSVSSVSVSGNILTVVFVAAIPNGGVSNVDVYLQF